MRLPLSRGAARIGLVAILLIAAIAVELNLLGVTSFPFARPAAPSPRERRVARILRATKAQCQFGNALVSAGHASAQRGDDELDSADFARAYAMSFEGTTADERARIEDACLRGLDDPVAH